MSSQSRTPNAAASPAVRTAFAGYSSVYSFPFLFPPPNNVRALRNSLLDTIDKLESLPALLELPSNNPLLLLLCPFLSQARAHLTSSASAPSPIENRLDKLESLVSSIDKKITPGQASYAHTARRETASGAPVSFRLSSESEFLRNNKQILVKVSSEDIYSLKFLSSE